MTLFQASSKLQQYIYVIYIIYIYIQCPVPGVYFEIRCNATHFESDPVDPQSRHRKVN
jgi:hypothetical protein